MYDRYFSGLKLSSAALALLLVAAGLYFGACSSDKGEKAEKEEKTVEVETQEKPAATEAPSETEKPERAEGLPPEITEPCSGKNEGDACSVFTSGGMEIKGKCVMTRRNILGCMPEPIVGRKKSIQPDYKLATPKPQQTE